MPRKRRTPKEGQAGGSTNISNPEPSFPVANVGRSQQASGGHSISPSSLPQVSGERLPPERWQSETGGRKSRSGPGQPSHVQNENPRYQSRSGDPLAIATLPQSVTNLKPSCTEKTVAEDLQVPNLPIHNIPSSKCTSVNMMVDPEKSRIASQQLSKTSISVNSPVACTVEFGSMALEGTSSSTKEEPSYPEIIAAPPASSKSHRFPDRPGRGILGVRCMVKANHFLAELPKKDIYHYDVSIIPEVKSIGFNRAIMQQFVMMYKDSELGRKLPVYDGRKSIYTAGSLPFEIREFTVTIPEEGDPSGTESRKQQFKVVIKFASRADLHHLGQFLSGRQRDVPQEALQALDIVLRELPTRNYTPIMRSFFSENIGRPQALGGGLSSWKGFYQSLRPTEMGLSLNIDISTHAFIEALPVIEFVHKLLNRETQQLSDIQYKKVRKALQGVKIQANHTRNMKRTHRIRGLTLQSTEKLTFTIDADNGVMKSVIQYFQETYSYTIMYQKLPCLDVGKAQRPKYLPMEVCKIVEGQCYSKNLSEGQRKALVMGSCQKPRDREQSILQTVHRNAYHNDPYCKEFGIRVSNRLESIEARILPTPTLAYSDQGKEQFISPKYGQWNMVDKKLYSPGKVDFWACINFSPNVPLNQAQYFCRQLAKICNKSGMVFKNYPIVLRTVLPENLEKALIDVCSETLSKVQRNLDLLVAILPDDNGSLYANLKRICETELGVISQCCLSRHVFSAKDQYLANVALKINVKVGGINSVLSDALRRSIPLVSDIPTIIFGADVSHPHAGEDSAPSIAAVVASQDWPLVTSYIGTVNAQAHRQEIIQDLFTSQTDPVNGKKTGGMIRELLLAFYKRTGSRKPERIIFFRDGVSEGQFYQVLFYELDAIHKACASLGSDYQPPVTFVVVQKRHHTRLFTSNHHDKNSVNHGNILPGTVVDSKICHPAEFDFYLCSHAGIQGTSRPAHYHVLWDDNNFSADSLQSLINNLCYTYARCTKSVSIVPPAYYAHLAAARASKYMQNWDSTSDTTSISRGGPARLQSLPRIHPKVKSVMFYC